MAFQKDESHWLFKLTPDEWIRAAMGELRRAEAAYAQKNARAGLAGAKRAAGMALNGALIVEPEDAWGRSYVDHLAAIARGVGPSVPDRVREACRILGETPAPGPTSLVTLRTASGENRVLEAARDVVAHAFAVVKRHEEER
jgi:HEPN domain-containing protein